MEPVQAQSMHITGTKSLCSTADRGEEISKQLEDQLLYGEGDDGEALSDDALSEDSYRLRVSDDENEGVEIDAKSGDAVKIDQTAPLESEFNAHTTDKSLQQPKVNGLDADRTDFTIDEPLDNFCDSSDKCESSTADTVTTAPPAAPEKRDVISVKSLSQLLDDKATDKSHNKANDEFNSTKVEPLSPAVDQVDASAPSETVNNVTSKVNRELVVNECSDVKSQSDAVPTAHTVSDDVADSAKTSDTKSNSPPSAEHKSDDDVCQIVALDKPEKDESSDSGIASSQSVTPDEPSKDASVDDESLDVAKDKIEVMRSESPILDCNEDIGELDDKKPPTGAMNADQVSTSKRHLSLSEESDVPKKLPCVETGASDAEKTRKAQVKSESCAKGATESGKPADGEVIDVDDDNTTESLSGVANRVENVAAVDSKSEPPGEVVKDDSAGKEVDGEQENSDESKMRRKRRSTRSGAHLASDVVVRTKREAAQKAEETVRKNIVTLNNDSDSESNDSTSMVPYNRKPRSVSPSSLKRAMDAEEHVELPTVKKLKTELEKENAPSARLEPAKPEARKTLDSVRQFFLRDSKQKLKKLTQEELEELIIQKIIETITMRDEIGRLREQAKISERNQEATRLKCQQLSKQIKDFEMVLNRFAADRRNSPSDTATPIKINRSVGLQVNFLNDHGVQNLRQLQAANRGNTTRTTPKATVNGVNVTSPTNDETSNPRRGIKIRSPRRSDGPAVAPVTTTVQHSAPIQPLISTVTPSAISISKPVDPRNTATGIGHAVQQMHGGQILLNGAITGQPGRTAKILTPNNKSNANLIDLTEEEEKKNGPSAPPPLTAIITPATNSTTVPKQVTRYQRVVPNTTSVTIPQSAIRVVQPAGQPTPTALVNNMNNMGGAPRFLVMQPNGSTRQLLLTPNTTQIRGTTVNTRATFSNITYASAPPIANGAVRVVPTSGTTVQLYKVTHPAPLPEVISYPPNPAMKLPPPAPSLKISKVAHGIVLSWNMALSDKYADIASYQLYAYQEIAGMAPTSSNWKKVGDVRALPLPMACTLTQFSEGNNYYFAVRAVDTHSRYGQYSQPGNISL